MHKDSHTYRLVGVNKVLHHKRSFTSKISSQRKVWFDGLRFTDWREVTSWHGKFVCSSSFRFFVSIFTTF